MVSSALEGFVLGAKNVQKQMNHIRFGYWPYFGLWQDLHESLGDQQRPSRCQLAFPATRPNACRVGAVALAPALQYTSTFNMTFWCIGEGSWTPRKAFYHEWLLILIKRSLWRSWSSCNILNHACTKNSLKYIFCLHAGCQRVNVKHTYIVK